MLEVLKKKKPSCKYSMTNIHQYLVAAHAATTVVARLCVVAVVHSSCMAFFIGICKKWHHMGKKIQQRNSEVQLLT